MFAGGGDALSGFPEWRPIVLYGGATWQAEKYYYQFERRNDIVYFANREVGGEFHGEKIIALRDIDDLEKYLIIVAEKWGEFVKVKKELEAHNLKEFKDFYYWEAYIKKIAVIHANCYGNAYIEFLNKSQDFTEKYFIYPSPLLHVNKSGRLYDALIRVCDLFIHQDIRKENAFGYYLSDEYLLPRLKESCKRLVVPNLVPYADVIFPQSFVTATLKINHLVNRTQDELFVGNLIIDEVFQKGGDIEEIMKSFMDINIVSEEEKQRCREYFFEKIESLKRREENWDVKISDYILENYQEYKLFTDLSHPSLRLMTEICRRIGVALNLKDIDNISIDYDYEMVEMFVMPWVKDALKLRFSDDYVRGNNRINLGNRDKLGDGRMDLREYIREYVYLKFGKFLD